MSLNIELSDEQIEGINPKGMSVPKINEVFQLIWNPPDGEIRGEHDGEEETLRYKSEDGSKIYLSRNGAAKEMGWTGEGRASKILNTFTNNLSENEDWNDVLFFLVETESGIEGKKCWRVSEEKIAKSIRQMFEQYFYSITESEYDVLKRLVKGMDWKPELLRERDGKVHYVLIESFFKAIKNEEDNFERFLEKNNIQDSESAESLLNKLQGKNVDVVESWTAGGAASYK